MVLGQLGDPRATGLLRAWLTSRDAPLRATCAQALGAIGTIDAKEALMVTLTDISEEVRLASVEAIGRLPGADTLRALQGLTRDPSTRIRLALARLVGSLRQAGAVELTEVLSQDPDESVRVESLCSLLLMRDVGALERFIELSAEQPGAVQQRLRQLPAAHPVLDALHQMARADARPAARVGSLRALAFLNQHPLEVLLNAFNDPSPEVRVAAVEAVASMKQPRAVQDALEQLLRDPDKRVRDAVRKLRMFVMES